MVLALKYRPRILNDLTGQAHVSLVLQTMLERWEIGEIDLPSALLFMGPRGSGKTSSARIVATYLNCEKASKPCLECSCCLSVMRGVSDSVLEIDAASHGGVADIRDLGRISRLAHSGSYRVIILDEAHSTTKEGFNALLKQLEEPSSNVIYILVTTEAHAVPNTIASRCLAFRFLSLEAHDIVSRLEKVCSIEGYVYQGDVLDRIARKAKGSLRDALMYLEHLSIIQDISESRFCQIWPDDLQTFAGEFIGTVLSGNVKAGMELIWTAHNVYRDTFQMVDSVAERLSLEIRNAQTSDAVSVLPSRLATKFLKLCWDLRIKARSQNPSDSVLLETFWHLCASEVGDSVLPSLNRPLSKSTAMPSAAVVTDDLDDLDAILRQ